MKAYVIMKGEKFLCPGEAVWTSDIYKADIYRTEEDARLEACDKSEKIVEVNTSVELTGESK